MHHLRSAGRIIACDRMANAALRIQAVCMATGQAAGALAALSAERGCEPGALSYELLRKELSDNHVIFPESPTITQGENRNGEIQIHHD